MAREEQDREDLLGEATALQPRGELLLPAYAEPVVVGFRKNGAGSVFYGADPAYHFNTQQQLRRAYVDGLLIKADGGRLVAMRRVRVPGEVQLRSRELTDANQQQLLAALTERLTTTEASLRAGRFTLTGEAPTGSGIVDRTLEWLAMMVASPMPVAADPRVG